MSNVLIAVFLIMLVISIVYAVRFPPLAVALGVAQFGLEQIASSFVVQLQVHQALFNITIAFVICASFLNSFLTNKLAHFETKKGRTIFCLLLVYSFLYWVSSIWSPFYDYQNSISLMPYFFVYVFLLPFLIDSPRHMIKAFCVLWIIMLVGFTGLLFSDQFSFVSYIGRSMVSLEYGAVDYASPLALADAAILLSLTSLLVIATVIKSVKNESLGTLRRAIVLAAGIYGIGIGLFVAFVSSRGETMVGVLCLSIFVVFLSVKTVGRATKLIIVLVLILSAVVPLLYFFFYNEIVGLSPRFSETGLSGSADIRQNLISEALNRYNSGIDIIFFGLGARGCEKLIGMYPHTSLIQALVETGLVGFIIYLPCILLTLYFGYYAMVSASHIKQSQSQEWLWVVFVYCLLIYNVIMSQKKGSLSYHESYMWLVFSAASFDRFVKSLPLLNEK